MRAKDLAAAFESASHQSNGRKPQRFSADILQPHMLPLHALFRQIVEGQGSHVEEGVTFGMTIRSATSMQLGFYNLVPNSSSTKLFAVHSADESELSPPATKPAPWHVPFEIWTSDMLTQERDHFYLKTQEEVMKATVKWAAAQCSHYPQKQESIRRAIATFEMPKAK